jgi:hypothetical protein
MRLRKIPFRCTLEERNINYELILANLPPLLRSMFGVAATAACDSRMFFTISQGVRISSTCSICRAFVLFSC